MCNPNSPRFRNLRKQVHQSARRDYQQMWDDVADNMEQASRNGDSGKLYKLIRHSTKHNTNISENIQDSHGNIITDCSARIDRWKEHFQGLLNHAPPTHPDPGIVRLDVPILNNYDVSSDPPTLLEVNTAIRKLKTGKAPGEDGLTPEIYKACMESIAPKSFG